MKGLLSLLALFPILALGQDCKCLYGQECWPSEEHFAELTTHLSQPLIYPAPLAAACYPSFFPQGNCTEVQEKHWDGTWRSSQPGQMQNPNFETFRSENGTISACYLNTTLGIPCEQGSVPPIGVDARNVEDVRAAVKFAAEHNLRIVVKNTGHDYLGRSAGRGGFMVWTHNLKDITYNPSFVPDSGPYTTTYQALTLGSGVQWQEAYDAAHAKERFIVGGISSGGSVGAAGGWIMGGGHSAFSPGYGLGVDNALQFTVVTADGEYHVANAYRNADLFWAMRGGGGGTFGIIISATYQTYESLPLSSFVMSANFSSPEVAQSVITEYVRLLPTLAEAGWGGYSTLSKDSLQFVYVAPNQTVEEANSTVESFITFVDNTTESNMQSFTLPFDNFNAWFTAIYSPTPANSQVSSNVELASRFMSIEMAKSEPEKIAEILLSFDGGASFNQVGGGAVAETDADSAGLNPAWRDTLGHVYVSESWEDGSSAEEIDQARRKLKDSLKVLDEISTSSGTYLNEASLYEADFQKTFFGSHYRRLKSIQKKYDSKGLFIVASGVGSEDWDSTLTCRK